MPVRTPAIWLGAFLVLFGLTPSNISSPLGLLVKASAAPQEEQFAPLPINVRSIHENPKKKRTVPISIPIHHKRSSRAKDAKRAADPREVIRRVLERDARRIHHFWNHGEVAHSGPVKSGSRDKRQTWETIPISSYDGDALYYASFQFGTPPQTSESRSKLSFFSALANLGLAFSSRPRARHR